MCQIRVNLKNIALEKNMQHKNFHLIFSDHFQGQTEKCIFPATVKPLVVLIHRVLRPNIYSNIKALCMFDFKFYFGDMVQNFVLGCIF